MAEQPRRDPAASGEQSLSGQKAPRGYSSNHGLAEQYDMVYLQKLPLLQGSARLPDDQIKMVVTAEVAVAP